MGQRTIHREEGAIFLPILVASGLAVAAYAAVSIFGEAVTSKYEGQGRAVRAIGEAGGGGGGGDRAQLPAVPEEFRTPFEKFARLELPESLTQRPEAQAPFGMERPIMADRLEPPKPLEPRSWNGRVSENGALEWANPMEANLLDLPESLDPQTWEPPQEPGSEGGVRFIEHSVSSDEELGAVIDEIFSWRDE